MRIFTVTNKQTKVPRGLRGSRGVRIVSGAALLFSHPRAKKNPAAPLSPFGRASCFLKHCQKRKSAAGFHKVTWVCFLAVTCLFSGLCTWPHSFCVASPDWNTFCPFVTFSTKDDSPGFEILFNCGWLYSFYHNLPHTFENNCGLRNDKRLDYINWNGPTNL